MARIANMRKQGVVTKDEEERAVAEVEVAEAQVQEAKAEEGIAQIEVQQAERRRQETEKSATSGGMVTFKYPVADLAKPLPRDPQQRLDELEIKLDRVLREIEAMRKEAAGKPRKAPTADPEKPTTR